MQEITLKDVLEQYHRKLEGTKSVACLNGVQECNVNLLKNSIEQTKNHLANYIAR